MSEDEGALVRQGLPARLVPIPEGWRIRRSHGLKTWQLAPPRAQPLVRALSWTPYVVTLGALGALQILGHAFLWPILLIGKGAWLKGGLVAAAGSTFGRLSGRLTAWYLRCFAGLGLTVGSLRKRREGDSVRLRGTVRADQSFFSPVSGEPAVFVHYQVRAVDRREASHGFDEVRGIDFVVDVDGSDPVRVASAEAFLTNGRSAVTYSPANLSLMVSLSLGGTRCREARIAPGDRVELIGILSRELDPTAQPSHSRDFPAEFVLRGNRRMPVLLRRLR